jgi:hypothetical protein
MEIYNIPLANKGKVIDQWYWRIDSRDYGPSPAPPLPLRRWSRTSKNCNVDPPDVTVRTYTTFKFNDNMTTVWTDRHSNWQSEKIVNLVFTAKDAQAIQIESWPMEEWVGQSWVPHPPIVECQWWDGEKFVRIPHESRERNNQ